MTEIGAAAAIWMIALLLLIGAALMIRALMRPSEPGVPKPSRQSKRQASLEEDVEIAPHRLARIRGEKSAPDQEPSEE